jgi:hypothetical protein
MVQKEVFIHIIGKPEGVQIPALFPLAEIIHDENILITGPVQAPYDIAPDKARSACDNDHKVLLTFHHIVKGK